MTPEKQSSVCACGESYSDWEEHKKTCVGILQLTEKQSSGGSEDIQRIDRAIEPEVNAEIAQMEKNFACHGNIYACAVNAPHQPQTEDAPEKQNVAGWEERWEVNFPNAELSIAYPFNDRYFMEVERVKDFIRFEIAAAKREVVEEIIENIPLCRDRITKCSCRDHDINDAVFSYLEEARGGR